MTTLADRQRRSDAAAVRAAAAVLRGRGQRATPGRWRPESAPDGTTRLVTRDPGPGTTSEVATLAGMWAPTTAAYLELVSPQIAYVIAEAFDRLEPLITRGELPTRVQAAIVTAATEINRIATNA